MGIQVGDKAPDFSVRLQDGSTTELKTLLSKGPLVLYFYPKDDTPGCTREACDFRDQYGPLQERGAVVLGVSADSEASHQRFATKYGLPFPLLVDADHRVAERYGAWGEKTLYGRTFQGLIRSTFLIGPDGTIKRAWPKVKVDGHVDEVLAAIDGAPSPAKRAAKPARAKSKTKAKAKPAAKKKAAPKAKATKAKTKAKAKPKAKAKAAAKPKPKAKPAAKKKTAAKARRR